MTRRVDDSPGRDEEGAVGDDHADGGQRDGAQEEEVHQLPLLHVGDAVGGDAARRLARDAPLGLGALPAHPQAKTLHWLAQRSAGPAELPLQCRHQHHIIYMICKETVLIKLCDSDATLVAKIERARW